MNSAQTETFLIQNAIQFMMKKNNTSEDNVMLAISMGVPGAMKQFTQLMAAGYQGAQMARAA